MAIYFISDLHLIDQRPDITRAFFRLLDQIESDCNHLYILGDFFEIWLGDDALTETALAVAEKLSALSLKNSRISIMHGNRDFLIGNEFAQRCNACIIDEPYILDLFGRRTLLMHGDTLCTEDSLYMDFRRMVRNKDWQQDFLAKSLDERIAFGKKARNQSKIDAQDKSYTILDVTPDEVIKVMQEYNVDLLIHGHTHRPHRHPVSLFNNTKTAERIVLGDWHLLGWYLRCDDSTLELCTLPLAP